jgi:carbamoyl-phosphate synthase large subunit
MIVIEMNPRVSRSSALASKATGFPIAKIAAKLAVGYTLDELRNDITRHDAGVASSRRSTTWSTKIPRFAFEKFPDADAHADHADEVGRRGDGDRPHVQGSLAEGLPQPRSGQGRVRPSKSDPALNGVALDRDMLERKIAAPDELRLLDVRLAMHAGLSGGRHLDRDGHRAPWFLAQLAQIVAMEKDILAAGSTAKVDRATTARWNAEPPLPPIAQELASTRDPETVSTDFTFTVFSSAVDQLDVRAHLREGKAVQ